MRRKGLSLAETLVVCFFISLMLLIISATIQKFFQARTKVADGDMDTQVLRTLCSTLGREVETASNITSTSPDLKFLAVDPANPSYLPPAFPAPQPALTPAWDSTTGLLAIRYYLNPPQQSLNREITLADGTLSQQRVLDSVTAFSVTNITNTDLNVTLTYLGQGSARTLRFAIHHIDS